MSSSTTGKRWPDLVDACVKCNKNKDVVSYASRGLCMRCHRIENSCGRLGAWSKIPRNLDKLSRAASQYTKDNYWRRKRAALIYRIVSSIGVTEASERLEVSKEEIGGWMNGEEISPTVLGEVEKLGAKIKKLTTQANSNQREEELFKNFNTGVRFLDGKII